MIRTGALVEHGDLWVAVGLNLTQLTAPLAHLPAFLAWWMPLNLLVALVAALRVQFLRHGKGKPPRKALPVHYWLLFTLIGAPMVALVAFTNWRERRRARRLRDTFNKDHDLPETS